MRLVWDTPIHAGRLMDRYPRVMTRSAAMQAIILGSGRGIRRLDPTQSYPYALTAFTGTPGSAFGQVHTSVLEWTLAALEQAGIADRLFVGGYHIQKVVERFPNLRFAFHNAWEREGSAAALVLALQQLTPGAAAVVVAGDVVIRPGALEIPSGLLRPAIGLALCDADQPGRWAIENNTACRGGSHRSVGILLVPASAMQRLELAAAEAARIDLSAGLDEVAEVLARDGAGLDAIDIADTAASIREERDLSAFMLGTKAQTLERLAPLISEAIIPPVYSFTVERWRCEPVAVVADIAERFSSGDRGVERLVVRSSSLLEDQFHSSGAGIFHSELDVAITEIDGAIERVIASYAKHAGNRKADASGGDQVLVQPYVANAACNGVLCTRVPDDGSPYLVLNYEVAAGRTDTVTSGESSSAQTTIRARHTAPPTGRHWTAQLMRLGLRLEELLHHDGLDIEFVVDTNDRLYLLQVRPLASSSLRQRGFGDEDVRFELNQIEATVEELTGPSAQLLGERGALGIMPDWNPAEIIGVCPRPLALSIYRHVVTDRVWARARRELGYRSVEHTPLMYALGGRPYIDVRASLNSLLPATLDDATGARIVTSAIARLKADTRLHDKIEFELMPTCGDVDPDRWGRRLRESGLGSREIERTLAACAEHTGELLSRGVADIERWLSQTTRLSASRATAARIASVGRGSLRTHLAAADVLLSAACELGTQPFAALARCAFIGLSLLNSMERVEVLTEPAHAGVLAGLPSVAGEVTRDLIACRAGRMSRAEFLEQHGHLRPGTYDILTPSYAEAPEQYLVDGSHELTPPDTQPAGSATPASVILHERREALGRSLRASGMNVPAEQVIAFLCAAIPARERAKHEFTRNISAALSHLAAAGERLGLSRDDLSYVPISRLLQLAAETISAAERTELQRIIGLARKRHELTLTLRLPHVLFDAAGVTHFTVSALRPNFVTRGRALGPGRLLRVGKTASAEDLAGAIVLIENADPGYDWVFSHKIAGLVTKYGGAASHMAIRAGEFAVPAAIGCGDSIFEPLIHARRIELDCAAERVRGAA